MKYFITILSCVLSMLAGQGMFNGQVLPAEKGDILFYNGCCEYDFRPIIHWLGTNLWEKLYPGRF